MQVGQRAAAGIRQRFGTAYRVGPIATTLCKWLCCKINDVIKIQRFQRKNWKWFTDPAAGGSDDWAYANTNASLTYCFELRDRGKLFKWVNIFLWARILSDSCFLGRFGFALPANQIVPNSQETVDGIVAMVGEARRLNYLWTKNELLIKC